jgi:hypothetical protein
LRALPFFNIKDLDSSLCTSETSSTGVDFTVKELLCKLICNPHPRALHVVHLNAEDLLYHFSEVHEIFNNLPIQVILVSETWLKPFHSSNLIVITGFNVFRLDRVGKGCGGVCIYIRSDIPTKIISKSKGDLTRPEFLFVEISIIYCNILLCAFYRAPTLKGMSEFESTLYELTPLYEHIIVG